MSLIDGNISQNEEVTQGVDDPSKSDDLPVADDGKSSKKKAAKPGPSKTHSAITVHAGNVLITCDAIEVARQESSRRVSLSLKLAEEFKAIDETTFKLVESFIFGDEIDDKRIVDRALRVMNNCYVDRSLADVQWSGVEGGCHVLFGGTASGKTTFLEKALRNKEGVSFYSISEPVRDSYTLGKGLRAFFMDLIMGSNKVIAVDSLRGIVYSGAGATLSGGISSELINILADFSRLSNALNKSVFVVINPLTPDEAKFSALLEALRGSASGVTTLSAGNYDFAHVSDRRLQDREFRSVRRDEAWTGLLPDDITSNDPSSQSVSVEQAVVGSTLYYGSNGAVTQATLDYAFSAREAGRTFSSALSRNNK